MLPPQTKPANTYKSVSTLLLVPTFRKAGKRAISATDQLKRVARANHLILDKTTCVTHLK